MSDKTRPPTPEGSRCCICNDPAPELLAEFHSNHPDWTYWPLCYTHADAIEGPVEKK